MSEQPSVVYVVRAKSTGLYWSASTSASRAPTIYTSHGKAEGRRKQLDSWNKRQGKPDEWEVKVWEITEGLSAYH